MIIESRVSGLSFCELGEADLKQTTDQIILKAAAICGCPIPQTEFFADVIAQELIQYLNKFGFSELTFDEIVLAMRLNTRGGLRTPTGIEIDKVVFNGSCFNTDYLSKILANYLTLRNNLDRKLENFIDGY